jgi:hypothetical protein
MVSVSTLNGMDTAEQKKKIISELSLTFGLLRSFPDSLETSLLSKTYIPGISNNIQLNAFVLSYFLFEPLLTLYSKKLTDAQIQHYGSIEDGFLKKSLTQGQIQAIINERNQKVKAGGS